MFQSKNKPDTFFANFMVEGQGASWLTGLQTKKKATLTVTIALVIEPNTMLYHLKKSVDSANGFGKPIRIEEAVAASTKVQIDIRVAAKAAEKEEEKKPSFQFTGEVVLPDAKKE